jgi:UDP-3-O-[3-hydroxymyristoyl] glucosamine N-acyltransferase
MGAALDNCKVGNDVVVHSGACIGQDGFGFVPDEKDGTHAKKPQELQVVIGDNVEIGANTCIDRGCTT